MKILIFFFFPPFFQLHVMVHDNAANAIRASTEAGMKYFTCIAHTINLIVKDSVRVQRAVSDSVAVAKSLVGHFKHSAKDTATLHAIQREIAPAEEEATTQTKVILQDVQTRWNSTLIMVERLLELRDALTLFHGRGGAITLPTTNQWGLLGGLQRVLKPFEVVTKDVSRATSSASLHIPAAALLQHELGKQPNDGVGSMKESLIESVTERFANAEGNGALAVATFLDPRFKDRFFTEAIAATTSITETLLRDGAPAPELDGEAECTVVEPPAKTSRAESSTSQLSSLWQGLSNLAEAPAPPSGIAAEMALYRTEPIEAMETDILKWWATQQRKFPLLSKAAKRYLSAPASSVDSERVFSASGNIYSDRRTRLTPGNLEYLVFLRVNLKIRDFDY